MTCPRCQHENPVGVRFCGECGGRLEAVCASCGARNPPSNKFCHQCGAALADAGPASASRFTAPDAYTPKHLAERILTSKAALELLVFEDLHWVDSESQAFLDTLVESLPSARALLLVNYRPEYPVPHVLAQGEQALV